MPAPVRIRVQGDQSNIVQITISSAIRLGRGGSAKFAKLAINHEVAISGRAICSPRAKTIVRLCVRS